jgi:hypothetical protein
LRQGFKFGLTPEPHVLYIMYHIPHHSAEKNENRLSHA